MFINVELSLEDILPFDCLLALIKACLDMFFHFSSAFVIGSYVFSAESVVIKCAT